MLNRWRIMSGIAGFLAMVLAVIAWRWLFPPFPDEQHVITLYALHQQEFAALTKMIENHCTGQLPPEATAIASRIDQRARVVCDYDGALRFILGVRGVMTVGPERIIGLSYIPGDPARKGTVVPALGPLEQQVGNVYLSQVDDRWYVFTQNTD